MFNALKKGNIGQTANELRSYGLLSTEVQDRIEAMGKAGATQGQLFKVFLKGLEKFNGALDVMSQTMNGVISTFKGLLIINLATGLEPWIAVLKQFMIQLNKAGGLLKGFAKKSKAVFQALEDMIFGKKKINPALQKFFSLLLIAPKVIIKSIKELVMLLGKLFGFVDKEIQGLTGLGILDMVNTVIGVLLKGIAILPQIVKTIIPAVQIIQDVFGTMLTLGFQFFNMIGNLMDTFFGEVKRDSASLLSDIIGAVILAIERVLHLSVY